MPTYKLSHLNQKNINIQTPLRLAETGEGYFQSNKTTVDATIDNLINCFQTKIGERVMRPTFGSNLHSYLFEQSIDTLKVKVRNEIKRVTSTYFNGIQIIGIDVLTNEEDASAPINGYRVVIKISIPELTSDEIPNINLDILGTQKI